VAGPREAGTPEAATARRQIAQYLTVLGYQVSEQPFRFLPGAVNGFPVLGAGLVWLTLLQLPLLVIPTIPGIGAPVVWISGLVAITLLAWRIGSGMPIPGADEREDANVVAVRPGAQVRRWIVAHIDSKAQGISMAGRVVSVWLMLLAVIALTGLCGYRWLAGTPPGTGWIILGAALSVAAGALASRGRLRGTSPGARDNGTGLLSALIAAEQVKDPSVGFLFTGAEEFGLVGARLFARSEGWSRQAEIINLDTLDVRGPLYLVAHDAAGEQLATRLSARMRGLAPEVRVRRLPLGILTDSLPFARKGAVAVTIARLDWQTLRRLHTPQDLPDDLSTETATRVGAALALG
jgi:hypothetical protein